MRSFWAFSSPVIRLYYGLSWTYWRSLMWLSSVLPVSRNSSFWKTCGDKKGSASVQHRVPQMYCFLETALKTGGGFLVQWERLEFPESPDVWLFGTGSQPWRAAPPKQVPEALALAEAVLLCHISVFFFLTFWRVMLGVVREGRKVESLE